MSTDHAEPDAEDGELDAPPVDRHDEDVLVALKDGSTVLIRPVHRDDVALLEEGFSRLSAESRRLRFLTDKPKLSKAELEYFTHVDHHDHEAIGARDALDGRGLGIARFIRDPESPEVAEVAVAVVDDWQRRGLGTELLSRLFVRAREEGIRRFTALVDEDNEAVRALMAGLGGQIRAVEHAAGAVTYEIAPEPESIGAELQHVLRAFGRGELTVPEAIRDVLERLVPERFRGD
jgi:RimJ/RimL family protein N-acetyltransferase